MTTRSFWIFSFVLLIMTVILLAGFRFFSAHSLPASWIWPALLSFLNTSSAAWFAVSGKEGTFKRLMGSIVFRLVALVVILLLLIVKAGLEPIPLMLSFILFFLLHQVSLILWLKREIRRTHSTLYPKGKGEDHA
ncbi:TPA: hypothetical protein DCG86_03425 [Candidatus Marinimicrobia bacterium]|nr:MAG: hypothetical protein XD77_1380 [Marinimicrobia bacterium 46_47]HAE87056.1 hypothetical protein [Candidatus Neomarinimicrobiota bacterium]HBY18508.1 hypothetical protein [Candidatus Neomarinimicrobiota bacterium]